MLYTIKKLLGINDDTVLVYMNRESRALIEEILQVVSSYHCECNMDIAATTVSLRIKVKAYKRPELLVSLYRKANEFGLSAGDFLIHF